MISRRELEPNAAHAHQLTQEFVVKLTTIVSEHHPWAALLAQEPVGELFEHLLLVLAINRLQPDHVTEWICDNENVHWRRVLRMPRAAAKWTNQVHANLMQHLVVLPSLQKAMPGRARALRQLAHLAS